MGVKFESVAEATFFKGKRLTECSREELIEAVLISQEHFSQCGDQFVRLANLNRQVMERLRKRA